MRMLHTMIRVKDLDESLRFYCSFSRFSCASV